MPPKKVKSVLLMVSNIGLTSLQHNSVEEEPFIDKAKYAMKLLVEKKIFLQPKDEIGIITMGDDTTDNPEGMEYVKNYQEHLLVPNWQMVRYINNLNATDKPCNWVEALHVALNFVNREVINPSDRVFIVIFNNFKESEDSIASYDIEVIVNDVKEVGDVSLLFVGENPLNDKVWRKANATYSEKFAMKVMKECSGQYEQINSFIEERRFYNAPPTNAMPWKFDLEVAELCIPCSSYVKITEDDKTESWKMKVANVAEDLLNNSTTGMDGISTSGSNTANVAKQNLKLDAQRNEMTDDEVINGYKYGGQYIPVSVEDEEAMKYEGSTKGMCVHGFVPQDTIKLEYWCGKGSRIIVPQAEEYATALYSLIQAMVENEFVAIVSKVHANGYLPRMGVLFPKVDEDEVWCLVHLELPYKDEIRFIDKKPIKSLSKDVTEEKLNALDDWIDSMTVPYEELPHLNPGCYPNIARQYHWNAMADRAVNPSKPLINVPEYLRQYLIIPEELSRKAKPCFEKLDSVFGWIKKPVVQEKVAAAADAATAAVTDVEVSDNMNVDEPEKDKDVPTDKSNVDEGFFSPEDIDLETGELDSM